MQSRRFIIGLGIAVVMVVTLACSALSSVPSEPAQSSGNGGAGGSGNSGNGGSSNTGNVLLKDDFSDKSTGWGTGTDADSVVEYTGNGLTMTVFKTSFFVYSTPNDKSYQNVHIEARIENNSTDDMATFGVMCDQQVTTDAYYYFSISPNGEYAISKAAVAKDDEVLTNGGKWVTSDVIEKNAKSYNIGADCGNGTLTLYVNGKKIDSVQDSSYTKGQVGLFAWNAKQPAGTSVIFHDFVMTGLQ